MKLRSFYVTSGLFGILTALFLLGQFSSVVSSPDDEIYSKAKEAQLPFLATLKTLVNIDSGTGNSKGLEKVENIVIEELQSVGAEVKTVPATPSAGRNIVATIKGNGKVNILLLAHTDTVFEDGSARERPFKIVDGKAYGPGVLDDKGGVLLGVAALKVLRELDFNDFGTITFLINPDEETGSKGSRELIKEIAKKHDYALVLEFGSPEDKVTSFRKGIGYYGMEITGTAAHAGANPEDGCNALVEASHQVLQIQKLGEKQTTVNVTVFKSGEARNTIPAFAEIKADVRVLEAQEYERLARDFDRLSQNKLLPCTEIKVLSERGRPPFPPNPKTDALVNQAQGIYQSIGYHLGVEGSGGGTDGNYAASVGTTTLDALGPVGGGAHSTDEYIELERIAPRIYLLSKLLMDLGGSK